MIIAEHLRKNSPRNDLHDALGLYVEYTPVCPWPEDCTVQWGNGLSPANPFFEAFIPGTFIRGDGETLEEAERRAFAKYEREQGCNHLWGRQSNNRNGLYLNGAGWCRRCNAFRSEMFPPVVQLGHHRRPLNRSEAHLLELYADEELNEHMDRKYPTRRVESERTERMLKIRRRLFGVEAEQH